MINEKHDEWAESADIVIDYTQKPANITFLNKKKITVKTFAKLLLYALLLTFLFSILIFASTSSLSLFLVSLGAGTFGAYACLVVTLLLFTNTRWMRFYVSTKTRNPRREITIRNPEGTIKYRTLRAAPLIDLEYDGNVRDHLQRATLFTLKERTKLFFGRIPGPQIQELTVTLKSRAEGTLTIKEY